MHLCVDLTSLSRSPSRAPPLLAAAHHVCARSLSRSLGAGTAALGGVRALTQYVVLVFVSATSMSTANIFTQILNIGFSLVLQSDEITVTAALITGIITVILASGMYAFIKSYKPFLQSVDDLLCGKREDSKVPVLTSGEAKAGWQSYLNAEEPAKKASHLNEPLAASRIRAPFTR